MLVGTTTYILRFGSELKSDMLAEFRDDDTVRGNLKRIISIATERGRLAPKSPVRAVALDCWPRTLNLDAPMKDHHIPEFSVLVLRDLAAAVKLTVKLRPHRSDSTVEYVVVDPGRPLKDGLKGFSATLKKRYRFYGRRTHRFHLLLGKQKLELSKSLEEQGIRGDIEVTLKPRVRFEWPPALPWPPGPFTGYMMIAIPAVLLIGGLLYVKYFRS